MELQTYHSNIQEIISRSIQSANNTIKVAVAWFTNNSLMLELEKKLKRNCKVELIILNDQINFRKNGIDFQRFISNGGELYISLGEKTIHHKFCILDDKDILTGSYNWTYKAEKRNFENVVFIKEDDVSTKQYHESFEKAKSFSERIINLSNFHLVYPPIKEGSNDYILGDLESQIYDTDSNNQDLLDAILAESTDSANSYSVRQVFINSIAHANNPLANILVSRSEAIKILIVRFYSWDITSLELHKDLIDKNIIIENKEILWSSQKILALNFSENQLVKIYSAGRFDHVEQFLFEAKYQINWSAISGNPNIQWNDKLLDYYQDKISWDNLIWKNDFKWTFENLKKYSCYFDWLAWSRISRSLNVKWTPEVFNEFGNQLNWRQLSENEGIHWDDNLIAQYNNRLYFDLLSKNKAVLWNETLIKKYIQKINLQSIFSNEGIQWTINDLDKLSNILDRDITNFSNYNLTGWDLISEHAILHHNILITFESKLTWWRICGNQNIRWDEDSIKRFYKKIFVIYNVFYWTSNAGVYDLCKNTNFPWTEQLIVQNQSLIDTAMGWYGLSSNPNLPVSMDFIRKYADKLNFGCLTGNLALFITKELIEEFEKKWNWKTISKSNNVQWSCDLLNKYEQFEWEEISKNGSVYNQIIRPIMNHITLNLMMNEQFAR